MSSRSDGPASYGVVVQISSGPQVECGFRVLRGEHPGLTSRWTHGIGALQVGRVAFTPFILGLRFLTRAVTVIDVTAVNRGSEHGADLRRIWSLSPSSRVIEIETATSRLEWAVMAEVVEGVVDLVDPARN